MTSGPGQPWPVTRYYHSAVSLHDPDCAPSDPALMMWGGAGGRDKFLGDGWVYRPKTQQCQKVSDYPSQSFKGFFLPLAA